MLFIFNGNFLYLFLYYKKMQLIKIQGVNIISFVIVSRQITKIFKRTSY